MTLKLVSKRIVFTKHNLVLRHKVQRTSNNYLECLRRTQLFMSLLCRINAILMWFLLGNMQKKKNAKINERVLLNNMLITYCIIHKNIQDIMKFIRFKTETFQ